MEKYEKDGMIAVLVCPGYGAGWSTWSGDENREILCMDADIVKAVLKGDFEGAATIAKTKLGDKYFYDGGAKDLTVEWVKKGSAFEIEEYDGYESLRLISDISYMVA